MKNHLLSLITFLLIVSSAKATEVDLLQKCWEKQVVSLKGRSVVYLYRENKHLFYHSARPWQTRAMESQGRIWSGAAGFRQLDSLQHRNEVLISKMQLSDTVLLKQAYWQEKPADVNRQMLEEEVFEIARYSPVLLIDYFHRLQPYVEKEEAGTATLYRHTIGKTIVKLFIGKSDQLLKKVVLLHADDMLGDVTTTFEYRQYAHDKQLDHPLEIIVTKLQDVKDTISLRVVEFTAEVPELISIPADYHISPEEVTKPEVQLKKVAEQVYSVLLPHTESQATLIEFKDFFVALDAPLSSNDGETVIREAQKIAPGKPVRYYAFGHHHPWYLGGVRPFIHKGATVLCTKDNIDYVKYLATAPHTLKADSLQWQPRQLKTELVNGSKTISDGDFEMQIHHIGEKSAHTDDYLIFYFPSLQLLIEDDLVWIKEEGDLKKAGDRQAGLYQAIKDLHLNVETIVQNWPVGDRYKVRSVIPFKDLEETVKMK